MPYKHRFSFWWSDELGAAITECAPKSYLMSLTPTDATAVQQAVNQGIDSHLQACYVPARGDSYRPSGSRMDCDVSRESLPVLVRRLMEGDSDEGMSLAGSICETLDIELI